MNLRCIYCQTPFTLARGEMLSAIVQMNEKNQNHYDAHCPRCRRANSISRQRMELFYPNWQEAAKHQPAVAASSPASASSIQQKTEPLPKGMKAAAKKSASKPAAKASVGKKPAARKRSTAKKTATKAKPAAKPSSKAKKAPAKGKKKK
jgi:hypothetical protein